MRCVTRPIRMGASVPVEAGPSLLSVEDLRVFFHIEAGTVRAVDGVTLSVQRGQAVGLVGESGCGKTITGMSVLGLLQPPGRIEGGRILFRGRTDSQTVDLAGLDPRGDQIRAIRGAEIAIVFQEPMTSLNPVYTVGDQIAEAVLVHRRVTRRDARDQAVEMLQRVGLPQPHRIAGEYPHQLSGGMRQRAMIAMALSCDPCLLIADEPTTALDVTVQAQILDLIARAQAERHMALLLITHDLGVVAHMAAAIAVMYLGTVVECGPRNAIFNSPLHPYTQALLRSVPVLGRRAKERLSPVRGTVPDPLAVPAGCPFAPRCPEQMEVCCVRPSLQEAEPGHQVACWLHG